MAHIGYSNTNTFQTEVERRYSGGIAFQWFYAYTHSLTTSDTGGFSFGSSGINSSSAGSAFAVPENRLVRGEPNMTLSQRLRLGYANSTEVPAHRVRWNGIYDLPLGKGKKFGHDVPKALDYVIGGWQLAFIGSWNSGRWMGVASSKYLFGDPQIDESARLTMNIFGKRQRLWFRGDFDPSGATSVDMAKLLALVPSNANRLQRISRPVGTAFDNRVDQKLADGSVRLTTVTDMANWNARNFMRGDGAFSQDASLFKFINFNERMRVRLTADFFNVLNHPINLQPDGGTGLQDLSRQANDPRIIQLTARFEW
ncbi:MAG: hypothetical protein NTY38_14100 [Acidobacteria bacterium]|nr:hypothetical protein [Acidobacteriota bacterium]